MNFYVQYVQAYLIQSLVVPVGVYLSEFFGYSVVFSRHYSVHTSQNQLLVHTDLTYEPSGLVVEKKACQFHVGIHEEFIGVIHRNL